MENEKYGLIKKNGDYLIPPQFDFIKRLSSEITAVNLNDAWGLIDKKGACIVDPVIEAVNIKDFSEGYSAIYTHNGVGFINIYGRLLLNQDS